MKIKKLLNEVSLFEFMIIATVLLAFSVSIISCIDDGEKIIYQQGNCSVVKKKQGVSNIYITICDGKITMVSNIK